MNKSIWNTPGFLVEQVSTNFSPQLHVDSTWCACWVCPIFSKNKMLSLVGLQHGLRSEHTCNRELLITTYELLQNYEGKTQINVLVLDFRNAFDVYCPPPKPLTRT